MKGLVVTASLIAFFSTCGLQCFPIQAETLSTEAPGLSSQASNKQISYDKNALRRLDLQIVGKSCPVCLLGIQRKVQKLPGVVKAAVMLKRPWCASFIYDSKKIQQDKIVKTIKSYEKDTGVAGIQDERVPQVPIILIPRRSIPFTMPPATSLK